MMKKNLPLLEEQVVWKWKDRRQLEEEPCSSSRFCQALSAVVGVGEKTAAVVDTSSVVVVRGKKTDTLCTAEVVEFVEVVVVVVLEPSYLLDGTAVGGGVVVDTSSKMLLGVLLLEDGLVDVMWESLWMKVPIAAAVGERLKKKKKCQHTAAADWRRPLV